MAIVSWHVIQQMDEKKWTCGHCGAQVAGHLGYYKNEKQPGAQLHLSSMGVEASKRIVICPGCERPTYFEGDIFMPSPSYGKPIKHLPRELEEVYDQARNCMSVNAFVPVVLAARTILMHIAVEQGAKEGEPFTVYVDHLVSGHYVPPNATKWIDHLRVKGNAATHKIALMSRDDAEKVLRFVEMILLFIYEYPNMA